nr:hypothetical protein [Tanacetum cinerariifolium]
MLPEMLEDPYVEVTLQAPPSPDYIPVPEEPKQAPPSPDYVPGLERANDEIEDPVDYPADGGDDGDDEEESSEDDEDDDMDVEADEEEEEEEHPALAESVVVPPTAADQAPSAKETEPFETDDRKKDRPEVTLPPRKRLDIALGPRYEVGESSSVAAARPARGFRADYGFVATVDKEIMHKIYMRLDDEQTERQLLAGRLNMLFRDRRAYAYTRHLMETEARMSREAWVRATDASDLVHGEVMSLRTTVLDHRRSTEILELRTALQGQVTALQGQVTALQAQVTTLQGQQGLAGDYTQSELPEEAGGRVTTALAAHDALRSTNGDDSHNSGTGTEGVASLSQWCERIESVFHISNCAAENQVKFATCTLHSVALTWWNTHVQTIRKLEMELWDLKVKGTDLASYTQRFQELALLCGRMFSEESDKIEKYVGGLPDINHGSVVASKPKTMQEAIEIATELMDKKILTFVERETASKRKFKNTSRNTQNQQQPHLNKRQNTGRVYTAASGEKKQYGGSRPLCAKCNYHHDGPCAPKCRNFNKFGHAACDYRNMENTNNANN